VSLLEFKNVTKEFRTRSGVVIAVNDLSFQVEKGQMLAFLGPNGAGKSTCLEMLLGHVRSTRGSIRVFDLPPSAKQVKQRLAVTPQDLQFPVHWKVEETLRWTAGLYQKPLPSELIERFDLAKLLQRPTGGLSGGERRRLGLCLAFCGDPELVLLDEPSTGLDLLGKALMWEFLTERAEAGVTVLLTTHDLFELSKMPQQRMLMVHRGRLVKDGLVQDLLRQCSYKRVSFRSAHLNLESEFAEKKEFFTGNYVFWSRESEKLLRDLFQQSQDIQDLSVEVGRIEDVFQILQGSQLDK
jgi:ABC-2 type transport system ATP-binding protein